jgi:anthranilate/para-aminobenzoate synthase component I
MDDNKSYSLYSIIPFRSGFLKYTKARKAYLYYQDYRLNLLDGTSESRGAGELFSELNKPVIKDHLFFHAFYELGHLFINDKGRDSSDPLGILIEYDCVEEIKNLGNQSKNLALEWDDVSFDSYKTAFELGYKHIKRGDCYQYNLTFPFKGKIKGSALDFAQKLWDNQLHRGAYGHFTYSSFLEKGFLSNSPECLFQIKDNNIYTMPIKGSIACDIGEEKEKAKLLGNSSKDESELYMITDLLRNDLNVLSRLGAKVINKKSFLKVPKLLHTYSLITSEYRNETVLTILKSLFPGGSITGAPKKRVVEIIQDIEQVPRGFYCGSTIIKSNNIFGASINIRSAVIDEKSSTILYGAGGGITFDSKCDNEYSEMILKKDSFSSLITNS